MTVSTWGGERNMAEWQLLHMAQTKIYRLCIDSAAYAPYYKARLILCNAIQNSKSQTIKSRL